MKQLAIPALELRATPSHLFAKRMKAEARALKAGCSEVEALKAGRVWLNKQK